MKRLIVSSTGRHKIDDFIAIGMKINAIKTLRDETGCSLREAKNAIEHLMGELTADAAGVVVGPHFRIKSFVLDCDEGEIVVDMEELKLKFLMTLPEIGIDHCGDLLQLVQFIEKWQSK